MKLFYSLQEYTESQLDYGIIVINHPLDYKLFNDWSCVILERFDIFVYYKHNFKPDVTFIIHGVPNKDVFINMITNVLHYGDVIISTWDILNIDTVLNYINKKCIQNGQNIYLQVYSTYYGLQKSKTKFAIKVRADEYHENFSEFINQIKTHPEKIITHNMFFRKLDQYPYHFSDHLIGGTTENLFKMFNTCKNILNCDGKLPKVPRMLPHCPEQWLTTSYLRCFYSDQELLQDIKTKMIKHFLIVPIDTFVNFVLTYNWQNKRHVVNGINDLPAHQHAFALKNIIDIDT